MQNLCSVITGRASMLNLQVRKAANAAERAAEEARELKEYRSQLTFKVSPLLNARNLDYMPQKDSQNQTGLRWHLHACSL